MTKISVTEVEEDLPFRYRVTVRSGGEVGLDVGDDLEIDEGDAMGDVTARIGLDMVRKGSMFMGLDGDESKHLCLIALKMAKP